MATTANATAGYLLEYRLRNHDLKDPRCPLEVQATPEEVRQLATQGYLVKERLLTEEQTSTLISKRISSGGVCPAAMCPIGKELAR